MVPSCAANAAPVRPAMMIAGHDGAHHPDHGDPDQVGHVDLGAEHLELNGPDEGQDQPHQEADQGDDGQGLRAALLDDLQQVGAAEPGFSPEHPKGSYGHLAEERHRVAVSLPGPYGDVPDPCEERIPFRLPAGPLPLGDRRGQVEEPNDPGGSPVFSTATPAAEHRSNTLRRKVRRPLSHPPSAVASKATLRTPDPEESSFSTIPAGGRGFATVHSPAIRTTRVSSSVRSNVSIV